MNGEREFKTTEPVIMKDPKQIIKEKSDLEYDKYLKNLQKEKDELRDLIFKTLFNVGLFIDSEMSEEEKYEVRNEMTFKNYVFEDESVTTSAYTCDIVD
jgi:hypothetical protein